MDAELKTLMIDMYNRGHQAGHHETVEGVFVDIHPSDQMTYHEDVIEQIIDEMLNDGEHPDLISR